MTFESLFVDNHTKQEVIVTFLALLELMRMSLIRVQQGTHFETIRVYPTSDKETQQEVLKDYSDEDMFPEAKTESL